MFTLEDYAKLTIYVYIYIYNDKSIGMMSISNMGFTCVDDEIPN